MKRQQLRADDEIEKTPEKIDKRRRGAPAGQPRERRRKSFAAQARDQMWRAIAKKSPGEEENEETQRHA
jgi:hypothetical protein